MVKFDFLLMCTERHAGVVVKGVRFYSGKQIQCFGLINQSSDRNFDCVINSSASRSTSPSDDSADSIPYRTYVKRCVGDES